MRCEFTKYEFGMRCEFTKCDFGMRCEFTKCELVCGVSSPSVSWYAV